MKYSKMEEELVNVFPELKAQVVLMKEKWGDIKIPTYVLYEETLNVHLHQLLINNLEKDKIKCIFTFYESMAICEEEEVRNLLQVALLEYLWTNRDIKEIAISYMHPNTQKLLKEVEADYY